LFALLKQPAHNPRLAARKLYFAKDKWIPASAGLIYYITNESVEAASTTFPIFCLPIAPKLVEHYLI
jgi:hypothetical protein